VLVRGGAATPPQEEGYEADEGEPADDTADDAADDAGNGGAGEAG
jgi:hypothetical protein